MAGQPLPPPLQSRKRLPLTGSPSPRPRRARLSRVGGGPRSTASASPRAPLQTMDDGSSADSSPAPTRPVCTKEPTRLPPAASRLDATLRRLVGGSRAGSSHDAARTLLHDPHPPQRQRPARLSSRPSLLAPAQLTAPATRLRQRAGVVDAADAAATGVGPAGRHRCHSVQSHRRGAQHVAYEVRAHRRARAA